MRTLQWRLCVGLRWLNVWNDAVLSLDEQRVRLYCLNWAILLMINAVWGHPYVLFKYTTNGHDGFVCVDLCSLNVWTGCHVGPGLTARTFALLRACLNLKALLLLDAVWSRNLSLMCCPNTHTTMTMMTAIRWSSFVECMARALCRQNVRLYCCFVGVWCSMRS